MLDSISFPSLLRASGIALLAHEYGKCVGTVDLGSEINVNTIEWYNADVVQDCGI